MNSDDMNADEKELLQALRTLAREEEGLAAPSHVEARLLQAFDENRSAKPVPRRMFAGDYLKVAAALVVAGVLGGYWWNRGAAPPPSYVEQVDQLPLMTVWPSSETLAWLDAEPESLRIVHVRVASATLAAYGYAIGDPDGDGLVDLEVIVGDDGMARGVRVTPATAVIY
jgi:hypothetical protein